MRRHESPVRRVNPSGQVVWVARYTNADGERRSAGTFKLKRDAQDAIDNAYDRPITIDTVGAYAKTWTRRHPRAKRTNDTNDHRIGRLLRVKVEGRELRHWPLREIKRRHVNDLVAVLLEKQGRSHQGAVNVLRAFSAMFEDAITDELADANPFKGAKVKQSDARIRKPPRKPRLFSFDEMHSFAAAAGRARTAKGEKPTALDLWRAGYAEAMVRVFCDCGPRLGEVLGLERRDVAADMLTLRGNAHDGTFTEGDTDTKKHERELPLPPSTAALLAGLPVRLETRLLFATPAGKLWRERNFYRDVWQPARELSGLDIRPHDCRHSWITHLAAAGVDAADLAELAGHSVATMNARYRHALRRSGDAIREAIG